MVDNIVQGVYIQTIEKGKVVQKYVPLKDVKLNGNGGTTLDEYIKGTDSRLEALEKESQELKENLQRLEKVFEDTIRGFITK